jgi:hypothetical protein
MIAVFGKAFLLLITILGSRSDTIESAGWEKLEIGDVGPIWWLVISLLASVCGIVGALRFDSRLVGAALTCYCIDVCVYALLSIVGVIFAIIFAYPQWFLFSEIRNGIMSKETYPNMEYLCCYQIGTGGCLMSSSSPEGIEDERNRSSSVFWRMGSNLRYQIIVSDAIGITLGVGFIIFGVTSEFGILLAWLVAFILIEACGIIGAIYEIRWMVGIALVGYIPYVALLSVLLLGTLTVGLMAFVMAGNQSILLILAQLFGMLMSLLVHVGVGGTAHVLYISRTRLSGDYLLLLPSSEGLANERNCSSSVFWRVGCNLRNQIIFFDAIGIIVGIVYFHDFLTSVAILASATAYIAVFVCGIYGAIYESKWMVGIALIGYIPCAAYLVINLPPVLFYGPMAFDDVLLMLLQLFCFGVGVAAHVLCVSQKCD